MVSLHYIRDLAVIATLATIGWANVADAKCNGDKKPWTFGISNDHYGFGGDYIVDLKPTVDLMLNSGEGDCVTFWVMEGTQWGRIMPFVSLLEPHGQFSVSSQDHRYVPGGILIWEPVEQDMER